jgi:hypothetical protein
LAWQSGMVSAWVVWFGDAVLARVVIPGLGGLVWQGSLGKSGLGWRGRATQSSPVTFRRVTLWTAGHWQGSQGKPERVPLWKAGHWQGRAR